jgi:ADP-heptose:LPS heptosyltransferase
MPKILLIRFSSIGDILLTTPLIRCLKNQVEDVEIHFLTKEKFADILIENPNIDKLVLLKNDLGSCIAKLKKEKYDFIADLHNNLRSHRVRISLQRPSRAFKKLNLQKWLLVNFKANYMPDKHIVERYLDTVINYGVKYDGCGLEIHLPENQSFPDGIPRPEGQYAVLATGALHHTKQIPVALAAQIINGTDLPIYLVGGKDDTTRAEQITALCPGRTTNHCGKLSLLQSAEVVKNAALVISPDSAIMHMAAAFNRNIISVWGNTVPDFGMKPLLPDNSQSLSFIAEVNTLNCRPCSKIGFSQCPKKHFDCMNQQNATEIIQKIKEISDSR